MSTLGRAYVEVRADTSDFPDDVRRAMRRLAMNTREDSDRAGNLIGQRLALRIRQSLNEQMRRRGFRVEVDTELNSASVAATEVALRRVTRDREVDVRVNQRGLGGFGSGFRGFSTFLVGAIRILGDFFNFGRQIGQVLGEAFGNITRAMGGSATAAITLSQAFIGLSATVAALAAVLTIMAGILGVVLAAASALYQALLLVAAVLPGLGLAFLAAFAPLVLIFSNLGPALEGALGETEDFRVAVQQLGRETAGTFGHLHGMLQFFIDMREGLQESFFAPINDALNGLDTALGPTFQTGFERIAVAAGNFAAAFIQLFDHPNTRVFFDQLFRLGELGFEEIGGAFIELVGAFAHLIDETFPQTQAAVFGIADTISGWADGLHNFASDPAMDDTLADWQESFNTIMELLGTIVELGDTLFQGFAEDGLPILDRINGAIQSFIEYLESPQGQDFFDGMRVAAEIFLTVLFTLLAPIISFIELLGQIEGMFTGDLTNAVTGFVDNPMSALFGILNIILGTIEAAGGGFAAWVGVASLVNLPLSIALGFVGDIRDLAANIQEFFSNILNIVSRLWEIFLNAAGALSPLVAAAQAIANALGAAVNFAQQLTGIGGGVPAAGGGGAVGGAIRGGAFDIFNAEGGIFTRPTFGVFGEAGPEVIIPLSKPSRAMELAEASGLTDMIRGGDGAASGGILLAPEVRVFVGDTELKGMIRVEVSNSNRSLKVRQMAHTGSNR